MLLFDEEPGYASCVYFGAQDFLACPSKFWVELSALFICSYRLNSTFRWATDVTIPSGKIMVARQAHRTAAVSWNAVTFHRLD